jgi:anti-anti-sigma regulatory factor
MVLRIERSRRKGIWTFRLSGVFDKEYIAELEDLFGRPVDYHKVIVDLSDVQIVDRAAVQFLLRCEVQGLKLQNCPPFVREWIAGEAANVNPTEG